jgi:hypothetical protein
MSSAEKYVLDANVFIQAKRRFYPFDVCPGYWSALCHHHTADRICSVDKVRDELENGGDDLWDWAKGAFGADAFHDSSSAAAVFGDMGQWVLSQQQFTAAAKDGFMSVADGWIAAYARHSNKIVVTLEESAPDAKKKVPLVNVCDAFGVVTITPYEMLRRLGVRMTWTPTL